MGLSLAERAESIVAVDISPAAASNTLLNYRRNGLAGKVHVLVGDLFSPLGDARFDLVLMNPPYLPDGGGEAADTSWSGGPAGRDVIDRFIHGVGRFLADGGRAFVVQSSINGVEESLEMLRGDGLAGEVVLGRGFQFETLVVIEARLA